MTELSADDYDKQWAQLQDFAKYNPGARNRRRLVHREVERLGQVATTLDVGCGLGITLSSLKDASLGGALYGIDFSEHAIRWAQNRFPDIEWLCQDIYEVTAPSDFDLVICTEVIEHLDRPEVALSQVSNLVRPGGHLILTTQSGRVHTTERMVGHVRHFNIADLEQVLRQNSFQIVRSLQWGWPAMSLLKYAANIRPAMSVELFGSGTYGMTAKIFNSFCFTLARYLSLPSVPWGPQILITAKRES